MSEVNQHSAILELTRLTEHLGVLVSNDETHDDCARATTVESGAASHVDYPTAEEWVRMQTRVTPMSREIVLEIAVRLAHRIPGNIIEFGVGSGDSTRIVRRVLRRCTRGQLLGPRKRIFACDSFKGLPERFENAEIGAFACDPPKIPGVRIVEGYFDESLTAELADEVARVSLASFDADLYSSTLCALRWLTPLLQSGSLLLFDEYLGEKESERRAHDVWLEESGLQTVLIAECLRDPSGWGATPDRRVLFQVAGDEEFKETRVLDLAKLRDAIWTVRHRIGSLAKLFGGEQ